MIKTIAITNHLNDVLVLEMGKPGTSGFFITDIQGLGPVKATINTNNLSGNDGVKYNSSRLGQRNIVLQLVFSRDTSVEESRILLYKHFPIQRLCKIRVDSDFKTVLTEGYIESCEPTFFSNSCGAQVSILCPDPYLYSDDIIVTSLNNVTDVFQFPFENQSLVSATIEFGSLYRDYECNVFYPGTIDLGIIIRITAMDTASPSYIVIANSRTGKYTRLNLEYISMITGAPFALGDEIELNSCLGKKSCTLSRGGKTFNILSIVDWTTDWLSIVPGDNLIAYSSNEPDSVNISIENAIAYEGV